MAAGRAQERVRGDLLGSAEGPHAHSAQLLPHCLKPALHYMNRMQDAGCSMNILVQRSGKQASYEQPNTVEEKKAACMPFVSCKKQWAHLEAHGCIHSLHSVLETEGHICRQGDGYSVQQVLPERSLLRIERGYQQRPAPVQSPIKLKWYLGRSSPPLLEESPF